MANHPIVHIEFPATDAAAAGNFYSNLFGWATHSHPELNYVTFEAEGGPGGGFPTVDGEVMTPGAVLVYVDTEDIEASLAKAQELGGAVIVPKTEIPGVGWFGIFADPTGNRVGLYSNS